MDEVRGEIIKIDQRRADNVGKLRDRMTVIESMVRVLPTHDSINSLSQKISELHGDMRAATTQISALTGAVDRVNSFLMKESHPK